MTIRWQGLWAMVAALICDISIVTQYVTMSLPSILVNYDWLSKRKVGYVTMFLFPSYFFGLGIYYKNKMSVIWKAGEIQET